MNPNIKSCVTPDLEYENGIVTVLSSFCHPSAGEPYARFFTGNISDNKLNS